MRGEDCWSVGPRSRWHGSPPHAWGRRSMVKVIGRGVRFTPTCVGKTCKSSPRGSPLPVHPHMRGEDAASAELSLTSPGSPPHAWGRPLDVLGDPGRVRFTPTCVGKTPHGRPCVKRHSVHPHMRGEDPRNVNWRSNFFGPQLFFVGLARCL